eukprot:TRINITY_DN84_c0_g1_i2.p1 TRINITY_DN84_c0_g1~~TRINITY_DN84_c0_g1_i2.p1  ORF type:complete len:202 (+),score=56.66 TRINITY_DN84_c0_g1_i2:47-607(+)
MRTSVPRFSSLSTPRGQYPFRGPTNLFSSQGTFFAPNSFLGKNFFSEQTTKPEPRKKITTGIVGVEANPNWKPDLIKLIGQLKRDLTLLPEGFWWRSLTEQVNDFRLKAINSSDDYEEVEDMIQHTQVEQMIDETKDQIEMVNVWLQNPKMMEDPDPDVHQTQMVIAPYTLAGYEHMDEMFNNKKL